MSTSATFSYLELIKTTELPQKIEAPNTGILQDRKVADLRPEINSLEGKLNKRNCLLITAMFVAVAVATSLTLAGGLSHILPILFIGTGMSSLTILGMFATPSKHLNPNAKKALDDAEYQEFMTKQGFNPHLNTLIRTYELYKKQKLLTQSLERAKTPPADLNLPQDVVQFANQNKLSLENGSRANTVDLHKRQKTIDEETKAIKALEDLDMIKNNGLVLTHYIRF